MPWFGVRSVVEHGRRTFEERIVLIAARDEDGALEAAERELAEYCRHLTDCRPLEFLQSYRLGEGPVGSGTEVFSLMRDSELDADGYLDRHLDTGAEHERAAEGDARREG